MGRWEVAEAVVLTGDGAYGCHASLRFWTGNWDGTLSFNDKVDALAVRAAEAPRLQLDQHEGSFTVQDGDSAPDELEIRGEGPWPFGTPP